jgi:hypothetical protein
LPERLGENGYAEYLLPVTEFSIANARKDERVWQRDLDMDAPGFTWSLSNQ